MKSILAFFGSVWMCATSAHAQSYSIDWFTMAGGGASTGGVYRLSGAVGQPAAAGATGGHYSLRGGFWGVINVIQTPGAPLLSAEQLGSGNVLIYWPRPADGFVLEQTSALGATITPTSWSQVPFPYQSNVTHISVTVMPSG